jgi:flagellar biosynthesis/type III secretory pathway chaperone
MDRLLGVLKNEISVLKKEDVKELENITLKKIALTEEIETNEKIRVNFLKQRALDPNEPTQWINNKNLKLIWSDIKKISEQAQKQNQINGMVINGNRRRVQAKIEIFSSSSPSAELTYSSSGENINQNNSKIIAHV